MGTKDTLPNDRLSLLRDLPGNYGSFQLKIARSTSEAGRQEQHQHGLRTTAHSRCRIHHNSARPWSLVLCHLFNWGFDRDSETHSWTD